MSALSSLSFLYVTVLDFECSSSSFIDGVVIVLTYGRKQTNLLILKLKKSDIQLFLLAVGLLLRVHNFDQISCL